MTTMTAYDSLLLEHRPRPIRSESAYSRMLRQVDQLMAKQRLSHAERDLVELLSTLIVQYESQVHPTPEVTPEEKRGHERFPRDCPLPAGEAPRRQGAVRPQHVGCPADGLDAGR